MSKSKKSFVSHKQPHLPGMPPPNLPDHRTKLRGVKRSRRAELFRRKWR